MVGQPAIIRDPNNPSDQVELRRAKGGRISVRRKPKVPAHKLVASVGDKVQYLGAEARVVTVRSGIIYSQDDRATEQNALALVQSWADTGLSLDYFSPSEPNGMAVVISLFEVDEEPSPTGFTFDMELLEVSATPANPTTPGGGTTPPAPLGYVVGAAFTIGETVSTSTTEQTEAFSIGVGVVVT